MVTDNDYDDDRRVVSEMGDDDDSESGETKWATMMMTAKVERRNGDNADDSTSFRLPGQV